MKVETIKAKQKRELRESAYGDWLSMKKRGTLMRNACVILAIDYGVAESTMNGWLATEARKRGECKRRQKRDRTEAEQLHRAVYAEYIALRNKGYTKTDACIELGRKRKVCWTTIYNWVTKVELTDNKAK